MHIEGAKEKFKPGKYPENKTRKRKYASMNHPTWHLKASFHELDYWHTIRLPHNLDVMHIEKNICESILGTLLELEGKNKDTISARLDLQQLNMWKDYWLKESVKKKGTLKKPPGRWTLTKEGKIKLCKFLAGTCDAPDL